jgi:hypothetical protein
MQAYISLIKTINPELTEDASRCVHSQESKQLFSHKYRNIQIKKACIKSCMLLLNVKNIYIYFLEPR